MLFVCGLGVTLSPGPMCPIINMNARMVKVVK